MNKTHFNLPFPESDEILSLYYALQDAGLPCVIVRHKNDPKMISVTPPKMSTLTDMNKVAIVGNITGFIQGWSACYFREALPNDEPLTVDRVPQQKIPSGLG